MPKRHRGFTLIEIVVVIVVVAILIAMASALTRGVIAGQKRTLTVTRMQTVDAALVQFVTQQKRLPCPANGLLASTDVSAGLEVDRNAGGCKTNPPDATGTNQINGVVPWRTLGLSEADATDGWDRRLTYRVFPALAADNGMDMSSCDPAGQEGVAPNPPVAAPRACNKDCTKDVLANCTRPTDFLINRGWEVRNVVGTQLMNPSPVSPNPHTGAAYVLISAGETGGGAYLSSGSLGASTLGADGSQEMRNYASLPYTVGVTYYVDDAIAEVNTTAHFDDLVSRPSVLAVITKAGLGPRSH
jgi:prepilin-type N-terminal cleavage/methylation domain-containing protein